MSDSENIDTVVGRCSLTRSPRKTLAISVWPDGSVKLVSPSDASLEEIEKKVFRRRHWIRNQQNRFRNFNQNRSALRFCAGATHRYLGKQYRIKISHSRCEDVKLRGPYFHVSTSNDSEDNIKRLMSQWFREHALTRFRKCIYGWMPWCKKMGLPEPKVHIRKMAKRWGSARPNGHILLNPDLVRTPSVCIDYVIIHELCHLVHPNHGRSFYQLLGKLCPNWKEIKERLERAEF